MNGLTKKVLVFVLVMAAVAATGWVGRKAYKRASEHRLIAQSDRYLATNDFKNAELCLRRALQVNPMSYPATKKVADMLDTIGAPSALSWRIRTAQLQPNDPTNRMDWAETALKAGDLKSAADALEGISGPAKTSGAFAKLSGALAWAKRDGVQAEKYYKEALHLEPNNMSIVMNLATIHLSSTNHEIADSARASLEQLSSNEKWRSAALQDLLRDAAARKSLPDALKFSKALATGSNARFADKISYLELLRATTNTDFQPWLVTLNQEATNSASHAFALGRWMAGTQGPAKALQWIETLPIQVRTNQPVPLIVTDCKIALKDWSGLLSMVKAQNWAEADFYRFALEALAQRSLANEFAWQSAWRSAVRLSNHRLDHLSRLAQVTAGWGWKTENMEVLREVNSEFPKEKWAANSLMAELYIDGNTHELLQLLTKLYADDPTDARIKNNLANLYLLRKSDLEKACRLAHEAYDTTPNDPFVTSTYAYSLLLQKKPSEALKVLADLKPEYLKIPSIAAYYGVVQAQSGHKDLAKESLQRAETAKLLPEEKELVHLAKLGL
jgi:predicted Zn-dependent protease